jgi:GT2 family glycosyltransferase
VNYPFFSIIIPTYNREAQLTDCLNACLALDYPRERFEVIVVDDGSVSPPSQIIQLLKGALNVKLFSQANSGPAAARNRGAAEAQGEFIAFTDDDCTVEKEWLKSFALALTQSPEAMVGGRTINLLSENLFATASQLLIDYLYQRSMRFASKGFFFTSNNMALSKNLFDAVGGFDVSFREAAAEDRELSARWRKLGYHMFFLPKAIVYHAHWLNFFSFYRQHFRYGRGAFYFHKKFSHQNHNMLYIEPLTFYLNIIVFPFVQSSGVKAVMLAALLCLSQIANLSGFVYTKALQSRFVSSTKSKAS